MNNISLQNFVVNVNPPSVPYVPGVDSHLDGIDVVLVYAVCMTFVVTYFCVVTADPEQYRYYLNLYKTTSWEI